ncbi:15 kDa protein B-like [Artibeus jamaicensis]|uniref:15 kDa protein B-like n=1 Tax=Artibeus jamaicensis TaxID=9417 RepID=UPI00235A78B7|nr:15 kDa protein B-like [Artibeus jamaicensis]
MAGAWRALLLMAGVAVMACVARRQSYEEIVAQALRVFNYGRPGKPLFRLLEVIPPAGKNSTTTTLLSFRVKETECLSGQRPRQRQPQECPFKDGGEERNCNGTFFRLRRFRVLAVDCPRVQRPQPEVVREKRSAESPGAATPDFDSSKVPAVVRDMYEKAKYDIIAGILRNF